MVTMLTKHGRREQSRRTSVDPVSGVTIATGLLMLPQAFTESVKKAFNRVKVDVQAPEAMQRGNGREDNLGISTVMAGRKTAWLPKGIGVVEVRCSGE